MEAEAPRSFTGSVPANRKNSRRRPLHTCGASFMELGQIAISKSLGLRGWIGSIMRLMAALARPFAPLSSILRYLFLAELSFTDIFIVATENTIEVLFPPSACVFNQIDELIRFVEALPNLFKYAENKFPMMIHQSPLLQYVLVHLISLLKIFHSSLTSENAREKEITVDVSDNELQKDFDSIKDLHGYVESSVGAKSGTSEKTLLPSETDSPSPKLHDSKQGYGEAVEEETQEKVAEKVEDAEKRTQETEVAEKETQETEVAEKGALERGTEETETADRGSEEKEDTKTGADSAVEEETPEIKKDVSVVKKDSRSDARKDSILDLFESTWQLTPPKKR